MLHQKCWRQRKQSCVNTNLRKIFLFLWSTLCSYVGSCKSKSKRNNIYIEGQMQSTVWWSLQTRRVFDVPFVACHKSVLVYYFLVKRKGILMVISVLCDVKVKRDLLHQRIIYFFDLKARWKIMYFYGIYNMCFWKIIILDYAQLFKKREIFLYHPVKKNEI